MQDVIFREYDIRGKVGTELILDEVYALGCAMAQYIRLHNDKAHTIAIGMDGRLHSPIMKQEITRACRDAGLHVVFVGLCPTPVLYFAVHTCAVQAGIMITASHNGPEYNGIKLCVGTKVVWGKELQALKHMYRQQGAFTQQNKYVLGSYQEVDMVSAYVAYLKAAFPALVGRTLRAVIDCGNGAAGAVLPALVAAMEWRDVTLLYADVDGTYPNHDADPVIEKNMRDVARVLAQDATKDIGIGLDGDADRMAPMTKSGYLVPGDQLLALFAQQVLHERPGSAVVFDIKSSQGLIELLQQWGAKPCISPSGHAIIKDQMALHGAILGGELSCHFFFHDRYFGYDDGMYAMLRLFALLAQTKKDLATLLQVFPHKISTRELRIACSPEQKVGALAMLQTTFARRLDAQVLLIDGIRATMPYGWGIVRGSNTQAVLCLRFESDTAEGLAQVQGDFTAILEPWFGKNFLVQHNE